MIWEYSLTTSTIWASFDYGEVEADTEEEALTKAEAKLRYDLSKVNDVFTHCDITNGFTMDMDFTQIEVKVKDILIVVEEPALENITEEWSLKIKNVIFEVQVKNDKGRTVHAIYKEDKTEVTVAERRAVYSWVESINHT